MGRKQDKPVDRILQKVRHTVSRYNMFRRGDRVVVAVSGGPDSVCLLHILHQLRHELGVELCVAHIDHGLRPQEDASETRFVSDLAAVFGLTFETGKVDLSGPMPGPLEETARDARYKFLEQVRGKFAGHRIAVGHTLDDQAETVLMRLLRGSGISGLGGIPPVREGGIVRPLIETTREEILAYLALKGLDFVTDSSNLETRFLRNRIRLEILPGLRDVQPRIIEILGQTAAMMRTDETWITAEAAKWIRSVSEPINDGGLSLPLLLFAKLPGALKSRVVRQAVKMVTGSLRRITRRHIEAVEALGESCRPNAVVHLPGSLIVRRVYDRLVFAERDREVPANYSYSMRSPGTYSLETLDIGICLLEIKPRDLPEKHLSRWTAYLDADRISYPLTIRNIRPGDRFVPSGMTGHRKLKDFFIDLKIPVPDRRRIPILTCGGRIVWVCGFRVDDRFKVTPDTRKVLKVDVAGIELKILTSIR